MRRGRVRRRRAAAVGAGVVLAAFVAATPASATTTTSAATATSVATTPAGTGAAVREARINAAVDSLTKGDHVYVAPGGVAVHADALRSSIGSASIYIAVFPATGDDPADALAGVATGTRVTGTYVVVDGNAVVVGSNALDNAALDKMRLAAIAAHPGDPVAIIDDIVTRLVAGEVAGSSTVTAPAPKKKGGDFSPLFLVFMVPVFAAIYYAVRRAQAGPARASKKPSGAHRARDSDG